jgi:hypothetical protein
VRLLHDKLAAIDLVSIKGEGIDIQGHATSDNGRVSTLRLQRIVIGRTQASGQVTIDAGEAGPIAIKLAGRTLDLSAALTEIGRQKPTAENEGTSHRPWSIDLQFGQVIMAKGASFSNVVARGNSDGQRIQRLHVTGDAKGGQGFRADIVPSGTGRSVTASAADLGEVLRGAGVWNDLTGGRAILQATYDDAEAGSPLAGRLTITDFRVRDAPIIGQILQTMTLYGLVEVMKGPGLGFTQLEMPFRYGNHALIVRETRAFSASLGLTVQGRIGFQPGALDLTGTVVPAYFFNSLLGRMPFVGRIFSPERGSGLFAATYGVHGSFANPSVSVNPLAALTPGILRGFFGIFQ